MPSGRMGTEVALRSVTTGDSVTHILIDGGQTGTRVRYWADPQIFPKPTEYDAAGFQPGDIDPETGLEVVEASGEDAWQLTGRRA